MAQPKLPLLLLDVDGVFALSHDSPQPGFEQFIFVASDGRRHRVRLNVEHGEWLQEMATRFSMAWATGWQSDAPRLLDLVLGTPPMPVIEFTPRPEIGLPLRKLDAVAEFVGEESVAWVDDDLADEAHRWAAGRSAPTLLISPDPSIGLTRHHIGALKEFSDSVLPN